MIQESDLWFCTIADGDRYLPYVPLAIHCWRKAYPAANIQVHISNVEDSDLLQLIFEMGKDPHVDIVNYPNSVYYDPNVVKCLLALLEPQGKASVITDVDMLIAPETPSLLQQRLEWCGDSCYANTDSIDHPETRGNRMTGVHFVKTEDYIERTRGFRDACLQFMSDHGELPACFYNPVLNRDDWQHGLWRMLNECRLLPPPTKRFKYHGLHLGHSRVHGRWDTFFQEDTEQIEYFTLLRDTLMSKEFMDLLPVRVLRPGGEVRGEYNTLINAAERAYLF